jgi:hypothetical protein
MRKLWRRFTLRLQPNLRRRFPPMMNRNSILLRRRNKVIVPRGDGSLPLSYTATINKNLEASVIPSPKMSSRRSLLSVRMTPRDFTKNWSQF